MAYLRRQASRRPQAARWLSLLVLIVVLAALQWVQQRDRQSGVSGEAIVGMPRLIDGDSFRLNGDEVRLVGIDAPEGRQTCTRGAATWACGEESRRQLARLIGSRPIRCRADERDQHGRLLAQCAVDGLELNREMVALGWAMAYGNYEREQAAARAQRRGLWSGEFQSPRDWRHQHQSGRG